MSILPAQPVRAKRAGGPANGDRPVTSTAHPAKLAAFLLRTHGGFSVDAAGRRPPSNGYAVSMAGHEERLPAGRVTADAIASYMAKHPLACGEYWGGWRVGETVFLDKSILVFDASDALALARVNLQQAIYDLATGEDVYLEGNRQDAPIADDRPGIDSNGG